MDTAAEQAPDSAPSDEAPPTRSRGSDALARMEQENARLAEQLRASRLTFDGVRRSLELLAHPALCVPGTDGAFFQGVAQAVVASLAEGCTIESTTPAGPASLAAAHADPLRESALRASGRPEPPGVDRAAVLRIPLSVRESEPLGVFTLWSETGRALAPHELTLAHSIAQKLGLVLEARRLTRVLEETREASDALLSMVSHEIRTPLATISMSVESSVHRIEASADEVPKAWLLDRLAKMKRAVRRTDRLLHTLLGMSQIQMGRLLPDPRETDASLVVRSVVDALRDDLAWAGCQCTVRAPGPELGFWDPLQLEIAVNNLVTNAIKYAPRAPLLLEVEGDADWVTLSVRDAGPGIPPEQQGRLFQRFSRLPALTRAPGFGLGLWITRHFVEVNGGSVRCDSALGRGTTFTLRLPRAGAARLEA